MADSLDINKWIHFAQNDFDTALMASERFRPFIEVACYHCQQSVEKILKAYIIANTNTSIKDHILQNLLEKCRLYSADFDNFGKNCSDLSPYNTLGRYPSDIEPTEYHMKKALKDAGEVLEFTKSKLAEMGFGA